MKANLGRSQHPRKWLAAMTLAVLLSLLGSVGCGNGSSNVVLPPGTNNGMLNGQYAFSFAGQNSTSFLAAAGSFTADGNGRITSGLEDITIGGFGPQSLVFTGTYSIGSDQRGTAVIRIAGGGSATWQFTMLNNSHGLLIRFDAGGVTASGSIDRQTPSAFNTASLTGNYVFGFSGLGANIFGSNASFVTQVGSLSLDGAGGIGNGEMDVNDSLAIFTDISVSGNYSVSSNGGRGTALINSAYGPQNFVFYVVDADNVKFVEIDGFPTAAGELIRQAAGPFSLATLNGNYAFTLGGADNGAFPLASGGVFTADGAGALTSGLLDENQAGNLVLGSPFTGTYTLSSSGRGEATFGPFILAFYFGANGTIELTDISGGAVELGSARKQSSTLGTSTVSGNYAVNFTGTNFSTGFEEDVAGVLSANGSGGLSGTLDINTLVSTIQGLPLTASDYALDSGGLGTVTINTSSGTFNMLAYQIDANTLLLLDADTNRVMLGIMQK
jgi:hypothetical protein